MNPFARKEAGGHDKQRDDGMIEPVALEHFFFFFFAAALVIFAALAYALLYSFSRLYRNKTLLYVAGLAYGVLILAVFWLSWLANLHGFWYALVGMMLFGYGVAPILIWRLSVATHD